MQTRPILIAMVMAGLSVALFSPQVSADPFGGAIVGGAVGAAVGGPPGAAVGAILGTVIGADMYYQGPRYAYGPAPYYNQRSFAPPPAYVPPPRIYYAPAPMYYAPRVVYDAPPRYVYGPPRYFYDRPRYYSGRHARADYPRYR